MKYLIVDDNKLARMALKQIASGINELELVAECQSAIEAYNILASEPIDLILLDIEMPEVTGLEFAKTLIEKNALIIFTTGKTEYAIDAFNTNVVDYIVKPVSLSRLLTAVQKAKEVIAKRTSKDNVSLNFFFLKDKGALKKLIIDDILFFEAMGDYVKIHTSEKTYAIHSTMKKIEEKLNEELFVRVHRSTIVALKHIERIEDGEIIIGLHHISLADTYKSKLNEKLNLI